MKNSGMPAICNDLAIPVFLTDFFICVFFFHSARKSCTHLPQMLFSIKMM